MIRGPDTPGNSVTHSAGHDETAGIPDRKAIVRGGCRWIEGRAAGGTGREEAL